MVATPLYMPHVLSKKMYNIMKEVKKHIQNWKDIRIADIPELYASWLLSKEDFEKPPKTPEYNPQVYRGLNGKMGKSKYSKLIKTFGGYS